MPIIPVCYQNVKQSMLFIDNLCELIRIIIIQQRKGIFCPQCDRSLEHLLDNLRIWTWRLDRYGRCYVWRESYWRADGDVYFQVEIQYFITFQDKDNDHFRLSVYACNLFSLLSSERLELLGCRCNPYCPQHLIFAKEL